MVLWSAVVKLPLLSKAIWQLDFKSLDFQSEWWSLQTSLLAIFSHLPPQLWTPVLNLPVPASLIPWWFWRFNSQWFEMPVINYLWQNAVTWYAPQKRWLHFTSRWWVSSNLLKHFGTLQVEADSSYQGRTAVWGVRVGTPLYTSHVCCRISCSYKQMVLRSSFIYCHLPQPMHSGVKAKECGFFPGYVCL